MNLCRTCKFWTPRDHSPGIGFCYCLDVSQKVILPDGQRLWTAQDFGCNAHQTGQPVIPSVFSPEEQTRIWLDFLGSRTTTDKPSL